MFGPRLGTVFASRWKALWWAASILSLAYCSVPAPKEAQQAHADQMTQDEALKQLEGLNLELEEAGKQLK